MYNQTLVKIEDKTLKSTGQPVTTIETPYNGDFVKTLKRSIPSAKWLSGSKVWSVDPIARNQVEEICSQFFPPEENLQLVRITWDLNRDNPQIDRVSLANVSRDSWSWKSNCSVSFKIVEESIKSGGSRANPGLFGRLVIETKIRPDADIYPLAEVEVISEPQAVNPLAGFSDDELLAELKRRGCL